MVYKRFRLQGRDIAVIIVAAVLAALAVFARSPENITVTSVDGVVTVAGEVPRSIGGFRVVRDDVARDRFAQDAARPVYRLEPVGVFLPQAVVLSFSLAELDHVIKESLAITSWNETDKRWEIVPSSYDPRTNTVNASIRTLGYWTLRER